MNPKDQVARLLPEFEKLSPSEIISRARDEFGPRMLMTTAFGYSGMVLLDFVKSVFPSIPCYFIDTGYHFEETLKLSEKIKSDWNLNLITIQSSKSKSQLEEILGKKAYKDNQDLCCYYRKVEPLMEVMNPDSVWLSATRRDQSSSRVHTMPISIDGRGQLKINPLFNWTAEDCWTHIRKNNIPYNPLHDQFYPSVGCYPCTNPVDEGGEERSGRWAGSEKIECGLHLPSSDESQNV